MRLNKLIESTVGRVPIYRGDSRLISFSVSMRITIYNFLYYNMPHTRNAQYRKAIHNVPEIHPWVGATRLDILDILLYYRPYVTDIVANSPISYCPSNLPCVYNIITKIGKNKQNTILKNRGRRQSQVTRVTHVRNNWTSSVALLCRVSVVIGIICQL